MIKHCVLFALLVGSLSTFSPARAQITLTVRSGIGIANGRSDYSRVVYIGENAALVAGFNSHSITKPYAGISARFGLSKELFLEPEISYTVMGFDQYDYYARSYESTYMTLPVSLRYQANKVLGVFAGPYVSYRLNAVNYYPEQLASWDTGFQVGGEVKIFRNFGLGGRFYNGLLNVYRDLSDQQELFDGSKLYNRCLQLYVSYSFDLEKKDN